MIQSSIERKKARKKEKKEREAAVWCTNFIYINCRLVKAAFPWPSIIGGENSIIARRRHRFSSCVYIHVSSSDWGIEGLTLASVGAVKCCSEEILSYQTLFPESWHKLKALSVLTAHPGLISYRSPRDIWISCMALPMWNIINEVMFRKFRLSLQRNSTGRIGLYLIWVKGIVLKKQWRRAGL